MKLKRYCSIFFVCCGMFFLTTCGKNEESAKLEIISAEELVSRMIRECEDIQDMELKASVDIDMKALMLEQEYKLFLKGGMAASVDLDSKASYVQTDIDYYALGAGGSICSNVYTMLDQDELDVWLLDNSNRAEDAKWNGFTQKIPDYSSMYDKWKNDFTNKESELWKDYLSKLEIFAETSDYKLRMIVDDDELFEIVKKLGFDMSEYEDSLKEIDFFLNISLMVDGKTYMPKELVLDMDMQNFEYQDAMFRLDKFDVGLEFVSYEDVEILIPEDVLDSMKLN